MFGDVRATNEANQDEEEQAQVYKVEIATNENYWN